MKPFDRPHEIEAAHAAWSEHETEARWAASSGIVSRILHEVWSEAGGFDDEAAARAHGGVHVPPEVATRLRRQVLHYASQTGGQREARYKVLAAYHDRRVSETLAVALELTASALMHGLGPAWLEWPEVLATSYAHAMLVGDDWRSARRRLAAGVRDLTVERLGAILEAA